MDLTPTPKIAPKGPKRPQKEPNEKNRAVIQKPKLIVYIGRFQKSFLTPTQAKNSPERPKKGKEYPQIEPN